MSLPAAPATTRRADTGAMPAPRAKRARLHTPAHTATPSSGTVRAVHAVQGAHSAMRARAVTARSAAAHAPPRTPHAQTPRSVHTHAGKANAPRAERADGARENGREKMDSHGAGAAHASPTVRTPKHRVRGHRYNCDRFISSRAANDDTFFLRNAQTPSPPPSSTTSSSSSASASSTEARREPTGLASPQYELMVRAEMLPHVPLTREEARVLRSCHATPAAATAQALSAVAPRRLFGYETPEWHRARAPLHAALCSPERMRVAAEAADVAGSATAYGGRRTLPSTAVRLLDAPDLLDDFYLQLVAWSARNVVAVALANNVFTWDAGTHRIAHLCNIDPRRGRRHGELPLATAIAWAARGDTLAVGDTEGRVLLYDAKEGRLLRTYSHHGRRVSSLAWAPTAGSPHVLASGSRDATIKVWDTRMPARRAHVISERTEHTDEVCGLAWSPDGALLASGGNDNRVFVWDQARAHAVHTYTEHTAAVKAMAWSPHERRVLATGGGSACRSLRFWDTNRGARKSVMAVQTDAQVCGLLWSPHTRELITAHGFTQNELVVWRYPTMQRVGQLRGHTSRPLYMAMDPSGRTVVSGAADETLRFWDVFPARHVAPACRKRGDGGAGLYTAPHVYLR